MFKRFREIRNYGKGDQEVEGIVGLGRLVNEVGIRTVTPEGKGPIVVAGGKGEAIVFTLWKENKEVPAYFEFEAWGKTAEILGQYGFKGAELFIIGRIKKNNDHERIIIESVHATYNTVGKMNKGKEEKKSIAEDTPTGDNSDDDTLPF